MKQDLKKQALRRLKIAAGQITGLAKMIEKGEYCVNIIHQSFAVKAALSGFEDLVLKNHLSTHVAEQLKSGKKAKALREILSIYKVSKQRQLG
ncbi:MAG: metal-sensing transcriptional repressor [Candidatus Sungiibacteriota bacterium]